MKKYRCHKKVEAAKIKEIEWTRYSTKLVFVDGSKLPVSRDFGRGVQSLVGGYYVKYEDGYESWSPAEAFESGYTEINYP